MININLSVMLAAIRHPQERSEVSNEQHHEYLAVCLFGGSAEPHLTGGQIRQSQSNALSGDLDRQGLQESANNDFNYQGQRLPPQRLPSDFRRSSVSKSPYHNQGHVSNR